MADSLDKYKSIPIRAVDIFKTQKFLKGDGPYQTILLPGLLPSKATVSSIVPKCTVATNLIINKLDKYREAGYFKEDTSVMALGQLIDSSDTGKYFLIANNWRSQKNAEKAGGYTKKKLVDLINQWFSYHKYRIGWLGLTTQKVFLRDPKSGKTITYNLADRYNKPINQCKYPPLSALRNINLSVGQAETITIHIVDKYINDNDIINFSQEENQARFILEYLSQLPTESSQTPQGAIARGSQAYQTFKQMRETRKMRERLKLEEIKTEEQAQRAIEQREAEIADIRRKGAEAKAKMSEAIDFTELLKQQQSLNPITPKVST